MNAPGEILGQRARVRWVRAADRHSHVIEVLRGSEFVPVLESLEGGPEDVWPSSPPLQDLHIEQRPGGVQVALLVGRAGRSHWSLSVLLDPAAETILFDAACRTSDTALWLGSTYRWLPAPPDVPPDWRWDPVEGMTARSDAGADLVRFSADLSESPPTFRWRYAFRTLGQEFGDHIAGGNEAVGTS